VERVHGATLSAQRNLKRSGETSQLDRTRHNNLFTPTPLKTGATRIRATNVGLLGGRVAHVGPLRGRAGHVGLLRNPATRAGGLRGREAAPEDCHQAYRATEGVSAAVISTSRGYRARHVTTWPSMEYMSAPI